MNVASIVVTHLLALNAPAFAGDVWTDPHPGIRYLHRSTDEPKEIHALVIDLSRPEISLRATKENEKGRTTSSFANLVDAAAAINGDFYNTNGSYDPVGLAAGEGTSWSDDSAGHRFIACTAAKVCEIDTTNQARAFDASWNSAVGGNTLLVNGGAIVQSQADDTSCGDFCTTPHPRTAVGLSADRLTLIMVVVEGRQSPILGMSTSRLASLMLELGADVALNLDGGGSSAMVVDGARVSGRPSNEPSERSVSNHLGVLFDPNAATTGRLVGFIRENDIFDEAAGIEGATVTLATGESATTDERGFYAFETVAPGEIAVRAERDGFLPVSEIKEVVVGITNWKSIALVRGTPDAGVVVEEPDAGTIDSGASEVADDAAVPEDSGPGVVPEKPEAEAEEGSGCVCVGARSSGWSAWLLVGAWIVLRRRAAKASTRGNVARLSVNSG